jgi:hypothetical protein
VEKEIAAERAKAADPECCTKCGTRLKAEDAKCLNCGSVRERPVPMPAAALAAR